MPGAAEIPCRATACVLATMLSGAATADDVASPRFELAPYTAYRFGGEFEPAEESEGFDLAGSRADGLVFDLYTAAGDAQWEVLYARQRTRLETRASLNGDPPLDVDAEYLHAGGTYLFDGAARRPFIALTIGVARFEPGPPGFDDESYFSASLGGGVQLRASKRLGVRMEGRAYASAIDGDSEVFCAGGALVEELSYTCAISAESSVLLQWEARVGVVFRF